MLIPLLILGWLIVVSLGIFWIHGAEEGRHQEEAWEADMLKYRRRKLLRQYLDEDQ